MKLDLIVDQVPPGARPMKPSPFAWLPARPWTCPRCLSVLLARESAPRCPRCGAHEDE